MFDELCTNRLSIYARLFPLFLAIRVFFLSDLFPADNFFVVGGS